MTSLYALINGPYTCTCSLQMLDTLLHITFSVSYVKGGGGGGRVYFIQILVRFVCRVDIVSR